MLFNNSLDFLHKMLRFDSGRKNLNSRPKSHSAFFHMVLNSRNSWEHNGISCTTCHTHMTQCSVPHLIPSKWAKGLNWWKEDKLCASINLLRQYSYSKSPAHKGGKCIVLCTLWQLFHPQRGLKSHHGCGWSGHVHSCRIQRRNQSLCVLEYSQMYSDLNAIFQQDVFCNLKMAT